MSSACNDFLPPDLTFDISPSIKFGVVSDGERDLLSGGNSFCRVVRHEIQGRNSVTMHPQRVRYSLETAPLAPPEETSHIKLQIVGLCV